MTFDHKGKYAFVTGGASGIGLAITRELLSNGVGGIFIADVNGPNAEKVVQELNNKFGARKAAFVQCDVTKPEELKAAFQKALETYKTLDIVINNAGILDESNWEMTIAINLTAVTRSSKLAFDMLGKNKGGNGGVVVNIASTLGLQELHSCPVYVATKHAVIGLSRSLGAPFHFDRCGVRVVTMCPGLTDTPLVIGIQKRRATDEISQELVRQTNEFTIQKPENVAKGVLHIIRNGKNGSVWVSDESEAPYELCFPQKEYMRKEQ